MTQPNPGAAASLRRELDHAGLWTFLEDPDITNVMVNGTTLYLESYRRGAYQASLQIDPTAVKSLIASIAGAAGLVVHAERPFLETNLPFRDERVQAVLPPVARLPYLVIRKPPTLVFTLNDLVDNGTLTRSAANHLLEALDQRKTLLIAGGVNSGKTTLLSSLLREVLAKDPDHRLVLCEDGARELHAPGPNIIHLLTDDNANVTMTSLIRHALRLNPDRIIVGEARGAEALDFVRASNTGHPGGLLTLHANSAREGIFRLDAMVMEAGVPSKLESIATSIDLLLFVRKDPDQRRLAELLQLDGLDATGQPVTRNLLPTL